MDLVRKRLLVVAVLLAIVIGGSGYSYWQKNTAPVKVSSEQVDSFKNLQTNTSKEDTIYISGAVMQPGVIKVPAGTRIIDAINLAGGLAENADISKLNLAQPVKDGMNIKVPGDGQKLRAGRQVGTTEAGEKININIASKNELDKLPGIGPTLAQRIVDYRQANGPFRDCGELRNIKGITESRYNKIKDKVTI